MRQKLTWALNAMNSAMDGVPLQYAQPEPAPNVGAGYAYAGAAGALQLPMSLRAHDNYSAEAMQRPVSHWAM